MFAPADEWVRAAAVIHASLNVAAETGSGGGAAGQGRSVGDGKMLFHIPGVPGRELEVRPEDANALAETFKPIRITAGRFGGLMPLLV